MKKSEKKVPTLTRKPIKTQLAYTPVYQDSSGIHIQDYLISADYVIVGGGTSGATLARLLSENTENAVVVLEAGGVHDTDPLIENPSRSLELLSGHDAEYFSVEKTTAQRGLSGFFGGRVFDFTSGRLVGGGSSINGMQYVRPSPEVIKKWAEGLGDKDWSPESVTAAFVELENYHGESPNEDARGYEGPVDILQAPSDPVPVASRFVKAGSEITKNPVIQDYNNPKTPNGFFTAWQHYQTLDRKRVSSQTAYLGDLLRSEDGSFLVSELPRKLLILTKCTVLKVLFLPGTKKANEVAYLHNGEFKQVYAAKGILLCSGIRSPEILMRSGIGPAEVLEKAGIPMVVDLPVGKNLANHLILSVTFSIDEKETLLRDPNDLWVGGAFLPNDKKERGFELIGYPLRKGELGIFIIPVAPKSRGSIRILSSDPFQQPEVDVGYLSDERDLVELTNAVRLVRKIGEKAGMKLKTPDEKTLSSDSSLRGYITSSLIQTHHWQGACAMGQVTDSSGKVKEVDKLFVVDTSIIPTQLAVCDANTSSFAFLAANLLARKIVGLEKFL